MRDRQHPQYDPAEDDYTGTRQRQWRNAGVVAFLLACFMRSRDPQFVHEQLVWIHQLEAEIETQLFGPRL
jgi:hypothetical protein